MTLRVLVVDDQALVRAGFRGIVAATGARRSSRPAGISPTWC
jgi:DNA-binding NarL/FixJ family response regulator